MARIGPFGFVEIPPSNAATFDAASIARVDRAFIGPAARAEAFATYMIAKPHPLLRAVRPVAVTIEPAFGAGSISIPPRDPGARAIMYRDAKITITYGVDTERYAPWPRDIPRPKAAKGTWLTIKMEGGGEFLTADNVQWADNTGSDPFYPTPSSNSAAARFYISNIKIELTWHGLVQARTDFFDKACGRVNRKTFLGKPPGTILLENYDLATEHALDFRRPIRHAIICHFLHRAIYDGKRTLGWNYDLRADGWKEVRFRSSSGWGLRYEEYDFHNLFLRKE